jgi:uroporphyrinogen decarboxylase
VLPRAAPAQVEREVTARLDTFAPGGGYVFSAVHNIQYDVPPENIVAMYDTARAYRL